MVCSLTGNEFKLIAFSLQQSGAYLWQGFPVAEKKNDPKGKRCKLNRSVNLRNRTTNIGSVIKTAE